MTNFNENQKNEIQEQRSLAEENTVEEDVDTGRPTIQPLYIDRLQDFRTHPTSVSEVLEVLLHTSGKNEADYIIRYSGKDLIDNKSFEAKTAETTGNFTLSMKKKEYENFRKKLFNIAELRLRYACPGAQDKKFVWSNAFYDCETEPKYLENFEQGKNSLVDLKNSCHPVLHHVDKSPKEIFWEFFDTFRRTFNCPVVITCFGIALAIVFLDIFHEVAEGFPSVFFVGESQAGKSTLLLLIAAIFGLDSTSFISGNSTNYAIMQELSFRLSVPVLIEELSEKALNTFEPVVKNAYAKVSRARGKRVGIEVQPIFTNFVTTSNHFFVAPSEQLLTRMVFAHMKKGEFDLKDFPYFDAEKRKELSQILPLLLSYRAKVRDCYRKVYAHLCETLPKRGRHVANLAISCTMWDIVNQILGYKLIDWETMAMKYDVMLEDCMVSSLNYGDEFLYNFTILLEAGKLVQDFDWKFVKDRYLKLNLNRYLERHNIAFPSMQMDNSQARVWLANDSRFDLKAVPLRGLNRAISIDVSEHEHLCLLLRAEHRQKAKELVEIDESEEVLAEITKNNESQEANESENILNSIIENLGKDENNSLAEREGEDE